MNIASDHFKAAVKDLAAVASGRTTLPILSCIHLEKVGDHLRMTATDLDQWLRLQIPAQGDLPKAICAPFSGIQSAAASLRGDVEISIAKDRLKIQSGFTAELPTQAAEEFPTPPDTSKAQAIKVPDLAARIGQVAHAMCADDGKPNLAGIHIAHRAGQSVIEATDGRKLAAVSVEWDGHPELLLPRPAVKLAGHWAPAANDLQLTDSHLILAGDLQGTEFTCALRLLDLRFPNAGAMLGMETKELGRVNSAEFQGLIKAASRFVDENNLVDIEYDPFGITVTTEGPHGKFKDRIDGKYRPSVHRMNCGFLIDSLAQCPIDVELSEHGLENAQSLKLESGNIVQMIAGARIN